VSVIFDNNPAAGWGIRLFKSGDAVGMKRVFEGCLRDFPWRGSILSEWRNLKASAKGSDILVAEEPSAGIVGFMVIDFSKSYISHVFVDIDWRLCGIGRAFLDIARETTGKSLALDVDEDNTAAQHAYKALGWQVVAPAKSEGAGYRQIRMVSP